MSSAFADHKITQLFERYSNKHHSQTSQPTIALPRVIFLSLFHLYSQWEEISLQTLYDSLIIFKAKRSEVICDHLLRNIDEPSLDSCETCDEVSSKRELLCNAVKQDCAFQILLLNKEKQNRLLWIDDIVSDDADIDEKADNIAANIDQRWMDISQWIATHNNVVTNTNYKPLSTNNHIWRQIVAIQQKQVLKEVNKTRFTSMRWRDILNQMEFCDNLSEIESELSELKWNFRPVSEVLQQANPTLIPMAKWDPNRFNQRASLVVTVLSVIDKSQLSQLQIQRCEIDITSAEGCDIVTLARQLRTVISISHSDGFVYCI